ncbi:MAG: T9SS type A sorting domain-containing protein [Bacteroidota bacterium]
MILKNTLLGLLLLWSCNLVTAQISSGGLPVSFDAPGLKTKIEKVTMPAIPIEDLLREDELLDASDNPYRFGYLFEVDYSLENSGQWETLADGSKLWRLQIECPGALSINLNYSDFELPRGGKLFIYNEDRSDLIGAFTRENNKPYRKFSTVPVRGDRVIVEYYEPRKTQQPGIIRIDGIVHGYRNLYDALAKSGSCNLDVICDASDGFPEVDSWRDQIRSVVALFTQFNTGFCTGALINNTALDCTPYVLTARHCGFGTPNVADNNLFIFNYENSTCRQPNSTASGLAGDGSLSQSISGMTVRATSGGGGGIQISDFALIELSAQPPASYNAHYAGWSRSNAAPAGAVAIHHPSVDEKRISFEDDALSSTAYLNDNPSANNTHWRVEDWDLGTTEPGSSGSPLFDLNGRIIGQLSGGFAACGNNLEDWYGKVWYSWDQVNANPNNNLEDWLDPLGTGATFLNGSDEPCGNPTIQFVTNNSAANEDDANIDNDCLDYVERRIQIEIGQAPSANATVTISATGSATEGSNQDFTFSPSTVVFPSNGSVTEFDITVRIYNDDYVEGDETILFSYSLNANGGDAVTGTGNQTHTLTISDPEDYLPGASLANSIMIFNEDFEGGSFPADWFRFGGSGNGFTAFQYGTSTSLSSFSWNIPSANSSNFVASNDDGCNCNMSNDQLISPIIDLTDPQLTDATLSYEAYYIQGSFGGATESAQLQISVDNGLYNTIQTLPGNDEWTSFNIDLSSYLGSNVQFRWVYDDGNGWTFGLAVDNVEIVGTAAISSGVHETVNAGTTSDEAYLGPFSTVHFFDQATGDVMISLQNLSAHDYGCTTVEVTRAGTGAFAAYNGDPMNYVTAKVFNVIPDNNNPTGDYFVFLYYTQAEINGWLGATGQPLNNATIIKSSGDLTNPQPSDLREENLIAQANLLSDYSFTGFFATGFSSFAVGPGAGIVLPIDLLRFDGEFIGDGVLLDWTTASETGNDYFELYRSFDGIQFESIAQVESQGNGSELQRYGYLDENYRVGLNYYQLKQVDIDGSVSFSEVVPVRVGPSDSMMEIFPNPTQNEIMVQMELVRNATYTLRLFDVLGKELYQEQIDGNAALVNIQIDLRSFANGVYLLHLEGPEGLILTRKVVKTNP